MSKYDFECILCRDAGREEGCQKCGKVTKIRRGISDLPITTTELKVPYHYVKNPWNSLILKEDKGEYVDDMDFNNYTVQLDKVYKHLENGGTVPNSALITAPLGYGKTTWAYSCILALMKNGYNVPPMIESTQLKSMQTKAYEKPTWVNEWNGTSYHDYINSDVLFIAVTKGPEYFYAPRLIIDVVDVRSKLSKPTVIISDWTIDNLVKSDRTGMLLSMLRGGTNTDPNKYLINICFVDK